MFVVEIMYDITLWTISRCLEPGCDHYILLLQGNVSVIFKCISILNSWWMKQLRIFAVDSILVLHSECLGQEKVWFRCEFRWGCQCVKCIGRLRCWTPCEQLWSARYANIFLFVVLAVLICCMVRWFVVLRAACYFLPSIASFYLSCRKRLSLCFYQRALCSLQADLHNNCHPERRR